jgi:hypothetical protein
MENRNGLVVDFQLSQATGTAERDMAPMLVDQARERGFHPRTLAADKGYDTRDCVADLRQRQVTPHVAQNTSGRRSAIDRRTTRHAGYAISQCIRKRVDITPARPEPTSSAPAYAPPTRQTCIFPGPARPGAELDPLGKASFVASN